MKLQSMLIAIGLCFNTCFAQVAIKSPIMVTDDGLTGMSTYDSLKLSQLPVLKLPEEATRRLIPYSVDNSLNPWMRPLVAQVGLECGQASSIGVVFTYEMDYLRNSPANLPENQYTTHFAYNFVNGGSNAGVSFYETYEILKHAGNPTVADYGGIAAGGPSRWMSGYNLYYDAMHNRVRDVYSIKVNTIEGLQTLKNWIYDHGNGSTAGGVGCFYATYIHPPVVLPPGTTEAGKSVIYEWGNSANHSMSIVGYNDSIRWDYNGDGRYTNDMDINADGLVNIQDWEIGGFKMANTYGSITGWGNDGFAYMMYKSVADEFQQGGIWNNTVVVIDVRDNYEPQLTAKVNLNYPCRDLIKVMVGVSSDTNATAPDYILHYPIFDFQGGCNPMQGTDGEQNIEFGLDLNLLLQHINPGQKAKYFLLVQENDPFGLQTGLLEDFELIDYTNGGKIISSHISELPLENNSITMASVDATVNFNPVQITTDTLPPIQLYGNYSAQLQASQGTPPYQWKMVQDYVRFDSTAVMPLIDSIKLQPSSNSNGKAKVELPFSFPYFGQNFNEVYATVDGYLMFENSLLPWPFYIEGRTYFIQTPMIAPALSNPFLVSDATDGIWYEETADYVTFRWRLSISGAKGATFNATARLFPDGKIEINYGEYTIPSFVERYAGISAGDGENYEILTYNPDFSPYNDQLVRFTPTTHHPGMDLSSDGLITWQTNELNNNLRFKVCVTDKYNLKDYKTFNLNTEGLMMEYEIVAGDDNIIGFGEEVRVTLHIANHNSFPIGFTTLKLNIIDPYIIVNSDQTSFAGLQPGESMTIDDAFQFTTLNNIPNAHKLPFMLTACAAEGTWPRAIQLTAFRAVTEIASIRVIDGDNGILEPGETALLEINIKNKGGVDLTNAVASISSGNPYLTIITNTCNVDTLNPGEIWPLVFVVSLASETPLPQLVEINLSITGDSEFEYFKTIPFYTSSINEDFESGDLSKFDWVTGGDRLWYTVDVNAYEGNYCVHSGTIIDNELSVLSLYWEAAYADSISFYYKVSSEANYDFLLFSNNKNELGKWAGNLDWTKAKFAALAGENNFAWKYTKDYSVSTGEDCAWIDYIVLPVFAIHTPSGNNEMITARLSVYPNPGCDELNISYTLKKPSPIQVMILDMHGRNLYSYEENRTMPEGEYFLKPEFTNQKQGTYIVILRTNSGILAKKIIRTSY